MLDTEIKIYPAVGGGFVVSYLHPFTKLRVRTQFSSKKYAENHRHELTQKFEQQFREAPGEMLISELMMRHLAECPKTELVHSRRFFIDFCDTFGALKLKDVTTDALRTWLNQLQVENGYKLTTMFGFRTKVNIFFRWLLERGIISVSPLDGIIYPRRPDEVMRKMYLLSKSEINDLVIRAKEYSPGFFYPIFLTFVETAAKSAEVMNLKWESVDFKRSMIHFPGNSMLQARTLSVSPELLGYLSKKRPEFDVVFTNIYGKPFAWKKQFTNVLCAFKKHCGLTEKWMYLDVRHSIARNFLAEGGDIKQLKNILGHRSVHTTEEIYGKFRNSQRFEISSPFES